MTNEPKMLELTGVTKTYGSAGAEPPREVLKGVDLSVKAGESLAVVGPSGCGKSTLLNIIGALDRPTAGSVILDGKNLADLDESQLARIRNLRVGFVFQLHHLLPQCTVLENVLIPTLADPRKLSAGAHQRAMELLGRVGLGDLAGALPGRLSGGERQRVAVVRALINQPTLLLADEPTGSLDHAAAEMLVDLLVELNRERNVTLLMVTHAADLAARMGRMLALRDGVLHEGPRPT